MFDFDAGKLLIVGVIALIFIPPKDLPRVLRQVGQFVGKMRRMAAEFQGQFMEAMREADMADLRKEARALADAARIDTGLDKVRDLGREMTSAVAARPAPTRQEPVEPDAPPPGAAPAQPEPGQARRDDPESDTRAFEDLKSELRPLVEEAREGARGDHGADQPHSA